MAFARNGLAQIHNSSNSILSGELNEDDLNAELKHLREELHTIKSRQWKFKSTNERDVEIESDLDEQSVFIHKSNIYIPEYQLDNAYDRLVNPCKDCIKEWWMILKRWVFIFIIFVAIITAGVFVVFEGVNFQRDQDNATTIKGECIVESSECIAWRWNKTKKRKHCGSTEYEIKIVDLYPCDGINGSNITYIVVDFLQPDPNRTQSCYTNDECQELIFDKNFLDWEISWSFVGAALIFLVAICWIFGMTGCVYNLLRQEINNAKYLNLNTSLDLFEDCCCGYYCKRDKQKYNVNHWDEHLRFDEKLDYFIGYIHRKYDYKISNTIIRMIMDYGRYEENIVTHDHSVDDCISHDFDIQLESDQLIPIEREECNQSVLITRSWPFHVFEHS